MQNSRSFGAKHRARPRTDLKPVGGLKTIYPRAFLVIADKMATIERKLHPRKKYKLPNEKEPKCKNCGRNMPFYTPTMTKRKAKFCYPSCNALYRVKNK